MVYMVSEVRGQYSMVVYIIIVRTYCSEATVWKFQFCFGFVFIPKLRLLKNKFLFLLLP